MEPIHDQRGETVGWLKKDIVYDIDGSPVAFIRKKEVINFHGMHLGRFVNGFFRDEGGQVVTFIKGATGGPILPIPSITPIPPIPGITPIRPISPIPPIAPINSLSWSSKSWNAYLEGNNR